MYFLKIRLNNRLGAAFSRAAVMFMNEQTSGVPGKQEMQGLVGVMAPQIRMILHQNKNTVTYMRSLGELLLGCY